MQKILKLTGVSILAIMATTNANAAGYTCEELIEYTSCNPGYYLNTAHSDYTYGKGWCNVDGDMAMESGYTQESCAEAYCTYFEEEYSEECDDTDYYYGDGYYKPSEDEPTFDFISASSPDTANCSICPSGKICAGGTAGATPCPAGSYCAGTGLKEPTGKCAIGSYALAGATACTTCPTTGLTDKDGKAVTATTSSAGSTSATACFVGDNVEFKDNKGIWHYKNSCAYKPSSMLPVAGECPSGYVYARNGDDEPSMCFLLSQAECADINEDYDTGNRSWNANTFTCECDAEWLYSGSTVFCGYW